MSYGRAPIAWLGAAAALSVALQAPAQAQNARINSLEDVGFGTIAAVADQTSSQNVMVCSYRNAFNTLSYSVTATGSGSGGAFELASGAATLAYDVQWADSPNQTGGTMLQPGVPASGFGNGAPGWACRFIQYDNASLIVTIRGSDLGSASAGSYAGSLLITITPE